MNKFAIMPLALMVAMPIGLGYADDSSLRRRATTPVDIEYNQLGVVTEEVIVDLETGELTDEEEEAEGSWAEVELADEQDEAIASESYEVIFSDGNTRKGKLDSQD